MQNFRWIKRIISLVIGQPQAEHFPERVGRRHPAKQYTCLMGFLI
jgi:hypothetical protein